MGKFAYKVYKQILHIQHARTRLETGYDLHKPKLEIFLFHSELVPLKQTVSPFLGLFAGGDIEYFGIFAVTLCYVLLIF